MNSHNQSDELMDLGLHHTLKNWAARQVLPTDGRDLLLKAVREKQLSPERKLFKLNFGWSFRFVFTQEVLSIHPFNGYALESLYSLKANMAIL
jgi:hypothetical protein